GLLHFCSPKQSGYVDKDVFEVENVFQLHIGESMDLATEWLRLCKPDIVLCCGWSKIVPPSILDEFCVIGMHPTKLPHGRGGAPIVNTILCGDKESAVSFYRMTEEVDFGDVVCQRSFDIGEDATSTWLYGKACSVVQSIALEAIEAALDGQIVVEKSKFLGTSLRPQRKPKDSHIDWFSKTVDIQRFIRACSDPYPVAFGALYMHKMTLFLNDGVVPTWYSGMQPGMFKIEGETFRVGCGDGDLCFYLDDLDGCIPRGGRYLSERVDAKWLKMVQG